MRVLTVADVYDALTADRVYRAAWPAERALALLEEDCDTAFDPGCVAALRTVVAVEQPSPQPAAPVLEHRPAPARGLPSPAFGEAAA